MSFTNRTLIPALSLLVPLILTACGGGGGASDSAGGSGSAGAPTTTPPAAMTPPHNTNPTPATGVARSYAYTADDFSSTVSTYGINTATGALTMLGTSETRGRPAMVTVDPQGKFAYVTTLDEAGVSAFRIDPRTGGLTLVGVTEPVDSLGAGMAIDASGRFMFLAINHANDSFPVPPPQVPQEIETYRIDPDTGALTFANTVIVGRYIEGVALAGNIAYVSSGANGIYALAAYRIDAVSGSLTLLAEAFSARGRLAAHPNGKYAYLAWPADTDTGDTLSYVVKTYSLNEAAGTITQVGGPVPTGSMPTAVAIHPSGKFAYVGNELSHDLWSYRVDATTGALIPNGTPLSTGDWHSLNPIAFDPSGKFIYVGGNPSILTFSIDPLTGALTPAGAPVTRLRVANWIATTSVIDQSTAP